MSDYSYGVSVLDAWSQSRDFTGIYWACLGDGRAVPNINPLIELSEKKWYVGNEYERLGISTDLREVRLFSNDDIREFWQADGKCHWRAVGDHRGTIWEGLVFPDDFYKEHFRAFFSAFPYMKEPESYDECDFERSAFYAAFPYLLDLYGYRRVFGDYELEINDEVYDFMVKFLDDYIARHWR